MLRPSKHWHGLLVFLIGWMLFMPHIVLAKSADNSKLPPELQNLPRIMELIPDPESEVKLDEVIVINDPKSKGQTVRFSVTLQPNEEPGGYSIEMDFVRGTYKATKEPLTEDIKQRADQGVIEVPSMTSDISDSLQAAVASGYTRSAALLTEDLVNWPLCETWQRLYWYSNGAGTSYMWVWAANPSQGGTHWYLGGYKNYPVSISPSCCAAGHSWAWYYNWDFDNPGMSTTVQHDLYIYGFIDGRAQITGYVYRGGEDWWLLHSHLYWWP